MEKEINFMNKKETKENIVSAENLKKIKEILLADKKRVVLELDKISKIDPTEADNRGPQFPEYGDQPDENALESSDFSTIKTLQEMLEKKLDDVDKALDRIDKGDYGVCKYCRQAIGEKRLLARPTAGSCISCKTELQEND